MIKSLILRFIFRLNYLNGVIFLLITSEGPVEGGAWSEISIKVLAELFDLFKIFQQVFNIVGDIFFILSHIKP